ncbi:hypothetical protein ABBQ32_008895 [Trebouxia sp. C0010 RCD-2024]
MHTCPGIVVVAVTHLRLSSRLLWVLSFCQHNGRWISPLELPLGAEAPFRTPSGLDFSALGVTCCPACHRFLDLPDEVKSSLPMNKENFAYILGWSDENLTAGRLREGMMIGYDTDRMKNLWPTEDIVPGYKDHMVAFMHKCHAVTQKLMSCFAVGLGLNADFFQEALDPHAADCQTAMYCNRYPSVEGKHFPEGALRIGAHTDFELLTLLFTRLGEVGLEYWSDDRLKSTFHRVRVPKGDDYQGCIVAFAQCTKPEVQGLFQTSRAAANAQQQIATGLSRLSQEHQLSARWQKEKLQQLQKHQLQESSVDVTEGEPPTIKGPGRPLKAKSKSHARKQPAKQSNGPRQANRSSRAKKTFNLL